MTNKNTSRQFGVICQCCNAVNHIDLDFVPARKPVSPDDAQRVRLAFERIQHMRITLKLSRQRLAEHLIVDDILQTHLDSHMNLLETTYQHLLVVVQNQNKAPQNTHKGLVEIIDL